MERNDALKRVTAELANRYVGGALTELQNFFAVYPRPSAQAEMDVLISEYHTMKWYWQQGYDDPQLESNYQRLLQRTYRLYASTSLWRRIASSPFVSTTYSAIIMHPREWSVTNIRQELESFVSEMAMVELEPANKQDQHRRELCGKHFEQMRSLFDFLWTSGQWTDSVSSAFQQLLLSPTIDADDQQLIVSAITLSLINVFDMAKFRVLITVYRDATDERVRQRALVGWVLGRNYTFSGVFPEELELVNSLLADPKVIQELTELQIQLIYCINAEDDHQKIQSEIMPELMNSSHFRVTRDGIEEMEEDQLENILHPEREEERMERVEESMRKMIDMQKHGSDIYFGGFAQMKRFPFFQQIVNWFIPFSIHHPQVVESLQEVRSNRFLQKMLSIGPFCNSDKYSFVFAYHQVLERIPQNIREMMQNGEASFVEVPEEEQQSAAYLRRIYLQDIYRFFRLFPHAAHFDHPFLPREKDLGHLLFFASPLFKTTPLAKNWNKILSILLRLQYYDEACEAIAKIPEEQRDYDSYMIEAVALKKRTQKPHGVHNNNLHLRLTYMKALDANPQAVPALQGLARMSFTLKMYDKALKEYDLLTKCDPEKRSYILNKMICLTNLGRYEETLDTLYRLSLEDEQDKNVKRVLAWALTGVGKYEQALSHYEQLVAVEEPLAEDFLSQGYCLWFAGKKGDAVASFRRYLKETGETAAYIIENEKVLLEKKGIKTSEQLLMLDAICS